MGEGFRGERLHAAMRDAPAFAKTIGEEVQLPFGTEAVRESFFAVYNVLGSAVAFFRKQCGEHAGLRGQGIDGILHHREFAGRDCAERAVTRRRNADGVLNLFPREFEGASGNDRRYEGGKGRVMPATFADTGECGFAETLLEFVSEDEADDEFATIGPSAFTSCDGGGKDVGGMRRVLLPVDVVVVH